MKSKIVGGQKASLDWAGVSGNAPPIRHETKHSPGRPLPPESGQSPQRQRPPRVQVQGPGRGGLSTSTFCSSATRCVSAMGIKALPMQWAEVHSLSPPRSSKCTPGSEPPRWAQTCNLQEIHGEPCAVTQEINNFQLLPGPFSVSIRYH